MRLSAQLKILYGFIFISFVVLTWSTNTRGEQTETNDNDHFPELVQRLHKEAMEFEQKLNLRKAKLNWEMVRQLNPQYPEVVNRIKILKNQIQILVDLHFRNAVFFFKKKLYDEANREFLLVLTYDPDHKKAKNYLRHRLKQAKWVYYTVVKGDSLKVVARKAYSDDRKDFLVASFNNLANTATLKVGLVLKLPILGPDLRKSVLNVDKILKKAQAYVDQKQYESAISKLENVMIYDPGNNEARDLLNISYYKMAMNFWTENNIIDALEIFNQMDPEYRNVKKSIEGIEKKLKKMVEVHYKNGVNYFINEQLEKAIKEWDEALRLNPNHIKAKKDIANAINLQKRLKQL